MVIDKKLNISVAVVRGDGDMMIDGAGAILVAGNKRNELLHNYKFIKII